MNFVRCEYKNKKLIGILENENIKVVSENDDMNDFILNFSTQNLDPISILDSKKVRILSPIEQPLQDIICLGINYLEHAEESFKFKGEKFDGVRDEAIYFGKRVNSCSNPNELIEINQFTNKLDYEVELSVIIGKDCRNVKFNEALDYVFGYTIANDISARDLQLKHKQWYVGKSLESSFAFGPFISTSLDPFNLNIKSYVNNELRQNSNTSKMIFNIPYIISSLSNYFTLKACTIISTGTPSGVGMGFNPPRFLKSGDEVVCEIEGLGSLKNYFI